MMFIETPSIFSPISFPKSKRIIKFLVWVIDGEGNVLVGSKDKGIGITDADHPEKRNRNLS